MRRVSGYFKKNHFHGIEGRYREHCLSNMEAGALAQVENIIWCPERARDWSVYMYTTLEMYTTM